MNYPKNRYTGEKPWMDSSWLYEEYVVKDRSTQDIADEYGCKQNTIQCWLMKHKIKKEIVHTQKHNTYDYLYENYITLHKTRDDIAKENGIKVESVTIALNNNKIDLWDRKTFNQNPYTVEEEADIINRYVNEFQSSTEIAKIYGVTHKSILLCLKRNNIERRNPSKSQFAHNKKPFIEALEDKNLLNRWHWNEHLSCVDIGNKLGCDPDTVRENMHKLGLKTRNNSESKIGLMAREKHHNWKGGICPLNMLLREYFRLHVAPVAAKRDNYTCCECGKTHTVLNIHHIYPFSKIMQDIYNSYLDLNPQDEEDKKILYDIATHDKAFLDIDNLQTLCVDCHKKKHSKTISSQAEKSEGSETI